jgi:hypothetical protein
MSPRWIVSGVYRLLPELVTRPATFIRFYPPVTQQPEPTSTPSEEASQTPLALIQTAQTPPDILIRILIQQELYQPEAHPVSICHCCRDSSEGGENSKYPLLVFLHPPGKLEISQTRRI